MSKVSKKSKSAKKERREQRFFPRSTTNPMLVRALGALGAAGLGAGAWAQFGHSLLAKSAETEPLPFGPWILAGGAVVLGGAIWLGTSGDPPLHIGDAGVGFEKGSVRRLAWHQIESIAFEGAGGGVLVAKGKDDAGVELTVRAPLGSQPQAAAWMMKEARARVPAIVDIGEEALAKIPEARRDAGDALVLDPIQVVGKHCAQSGAVIAYEPDGRVCVRCERVYHRAHVPDECACGASLTSLQAKAAG